MPDRRWRYLTYLARPVGNLARMGPYRRVQLGASSRYGWAPSIRHIGGPRAIGRLKSTIYASEAVRRYLPPARYRHMELMSGRPQPQRDLEFPRAIAPRAPMGKGTSQPRKSPPCGPF